MFKLIFIILLAYLFIYIRKEKIHIKFKTFLKSGFAPKRGDFGLYVYDGKQGKGKTYSLVEYLLDHSEKIEVFCNISDIRNIQYNYYTGFKGLIEIKEKLDNGEYVPTPGKQLVIVYDEIFTELQKYSKLNKDVIDFLCQMRKRKIIFLTTAQEWAEIPLTFRRFCRYEIKCNMINFLGLGILIKRFGDAENMKWDETEQEHVCPVTETSITKCRTFIANSYDTFLRISSTQPTYSSNFSEPGDINIASSEEKIEEEDLSDTKIDKDFWNNDVTINDVVNEETE